MLLVRLEKEPRSLEVGRGERNTNPKIPTDLKTPTSSVFVCQGGNETAAADFPGILDLPELPCSHPGHAHMKAHLYFPVSVASQVLPRLLW